MEEKVIASERSLRAKQSPHRRRLLRREEHPPRSDNDSYGDCFVGKNTFLAVTAEQ